MTGYDLSLGFIGLGALGLPMAANLRKAGFRLNVHTRSRSPVSRASTVDPATLYGPILTGGRLDATQAVTPMRNTV